MEHMSIQAKVQSIYSLLTTGSHLILQIQNMFNLMSRTLLSFSIVPEIQSLNLESRQVKTLYIPDK